MAYETGTNYLQVKGPQEPAAATSKYLLVWRREADGQWRVAAISVTNSLPSRSACPVRPGWLLKDQPTTWELRS
jgi:ketosteroid isomerase-like protein